MTKTQLLPLAGGTRITYQLGADPNGRQPAMLARAIIRESLEKLVDEVRSEIEIRSR